MTNSKCIYLPKPSRILHESRGAYMLTRDNLEDLKSTALNAYSCDDLVDITNIKIDRTKSVTKRVTDFMSDVKNPYLFKVEDTPVEVRFSKDAPELQAKITSLIKASQA